MARPPDLEQCAANPGAHVFDGPFRDADSAWWVVHGGWTGPDNAVACGTGGWPLGAFECIGKSLGRRILRW